MSTLPSGNGPTRSRQSPASTTSDSNGPIRRGSRTNASPREYEASRQEGGGPVICEELEYRQKHESSEIIEVLLDPGETVVAETGAFLAAGPDVKLASRLGQVQKQGWKTAIKSGGAAAKRVATGESLFVTHLTNTSETSTESVWLAAPYLGDLIRIPLDEMGGEIICQRGAFLAAAHGTTIHIHTVKKFTAGLFGGEGLFLQKIRGDGLLVLHAGGSYEAIYLNDEALQVDTGCLVAFQPSLKYSITPTGKLRSMLFSGEGLFLAKLSGTGWVYIQSLPIERLTALLARQLRQLEKTVKKK